MKYTNSKGKFAKGNPGKPKGALSKKTEQWHEIGNYLVNEGADRFIGILRDQEDEKFLQHYTTILEYFKPKQSRVDSHNINEDTVTVKFEYEDND